MNAEKEREKVHILRIEKEIKRKEVTLFCGQCIIPVHDKYCPHCGKLLDKEDVREAEYYQHPRLEFSPWFIREKQKRGQKR